MTTDYEWDAETFDPETKDILEHSHSEKAKDMVASYRASPTDTYMVLVRDVGDDLDGLQDRQWAYVEDGELPEFFDGGAIIPKRFRAELAKVLAS